MFGLTIGTGALIFACGVCIGNIVPILFKNDEDYYEFVDEAIEDAKVKWEQEQDLKIEKIIQERSSIQSGKDNENKIQIEEI
ncbi:MAG: hypothetical protein ACRCX8_05255 [Sarcina sp.]